MAKKRKNITRKKVAQTENKPFIPQVNAKPEEDFGPFDEDGLSERQRDFAIAMAGPSGGNAAKAAEMAGYASENRNALFATASRLLSNAKVSELVSRLLSKRRATPEWTKDRTIGYSRSNMGNFLTIGPDGEAHLDMAKAAAMGALDQIKEYKEEGIKAGDGEATIIKRTIKVHDPLPALHILLKLHGMLSDNGVNTTDDSNEIRVRSVKRKPEEDAAPDSG